MTLKAGRLKLASEQDLRGWYKQLQNAAIDAVKAQERSARSRFAGRTTPDPFDTPQWAGNVERYIVPEARKLFAQIAKQIGDKAELTLKSLVDAQVDETRAAALTFGYEIARQLSHNLNKSSQTKRVALTAAGALDEDDDDQDEPYGEADANDSDTWLAILAAVFLSAQGQSFGIGRTVTAAVSNYTQQAVSLINAAVGITSTTPIQDYALSADQRSKAAGGGNAPLETPDEPMAVTSFTWVLGENPCEICEPEEGEHDDLSDLDDIPEHIGCCCSADLNLQTLGDVAIAANDLAAARPPAFDRG